MTRLSAAVRWLLFWLFLILAIVGIWALLAIAWLGERGVL